MKLTDTNSEPLHRFPVVRTSDAEQLRQLGMQWLGASRVDLRNIGSFHARLNAVSLASTSLAFGATSCDLVADHIPMDVVRLQIALKGRGLTCVGHQITEVNEKQFAVAPAGVPWQMASQGGHQRLTLRIHQPALLQRLSALVGVKPKTDYRFESAIPADEPRSRSLFQLIEFLSNQLDAGASAWPAAVYASSKTRCRSPSCPASRHKLRELLDTPGAMPDFGLVKRLEQFIEASWREAITIERLVAEAGVSARSIFSAFERVRGYSPIAFAKSVRAAARPRIVALRRSRGDRGLGCGRLQFRQPRAFRALLPGDVRRAALGDGSEAQDRPHRIALQIAGARCVGSGDETRSRC